MKYIISIQNFFEIENETVTLNKGLPLSRTLSRVLLALTYTSKEKTKQGRETILKHYLCKFLQVPETKFLVGSEAGPAVITMFVIDKYSARIEYEIGRLGKVQEVSRHTEEMPGVMLVPEVPVLANGPDLQALYSSFKTDSLDMIPLEFYSKLLLPEKRDLEKYEEVLNFLEERAEFNIKTKDSGFALIRNKKELPIGLATQTQQFLLQLILLIRSGEFEKIDYLIVEENRDGVALSSICEFFNNTLIEAKD